MMLIMKILVVFFADTVRAFKQRMKLGRFAEKDPEEEQRLEEEKKQKEAEDKALIDAMNIGDRWVKIFSHQ